MACQQRLHDQYLKVPQQLDARRETGKHLTLYTLTYSYNQGGGHNHFVSYPNLHPTRSYKQQHSLCRCLCIRLHLQALLGKEAANLWLALITKSMMVSTSLVLSAEAHTARSCRTKATDWQEASTQNLRHSKAPGKSYKQYLVMRPDVFTHPSWTC